MIWGQPRINTNEHEPEGESYSPGFHNSCLFVFISGLMGPIKHGRMFRRGKNFHEVATPLATSKWVGQEEEIDRAQKIDKTAGRTR